MTAQLLTSQLTNLIQESKRKNVELRNAAEKALGDLKSLPTTSETQLASDLCRRPNFIKPFLVACGIPNGKVAGIAIVCLQRLVLFQGLSKERLEDVLDALDEATPQNADVQLRILQILPAIFQNYGDDLKGDLVSKSLLICSNLQASKVGVVHSTAAATFQQLAVAVFDRIVVEDAKPLNEPVRQHVPALKGETQVQAAALDAYKVLNDICLLTEGQKPQFLRVKSLTQPFGLELIEAILSNHWDVFELHPEQTEILRSRILPLVIKIISERSSFPSTVRAVRLLYAIIKHHSLIPPSECEGGVELMIRLLEPDHGTPWKRALCMEVWKGIYAEPGLLMELYARFDEQQGRKDIVRNHLGILARLAAEKPEVIGLGQQSKVPATLPGPRDQGTQQAVMEAGGLAGMIGGAVSSDDMEIQGISIQWSSVRVSCIDQLDKTDPPTLPESYIYSLALTCLNFFSDGLAKSVLPLTIANGNRDKKRAILPVIRSQDELSEPATGSPRRAPMDLRDRPGKEPFEKLPDSINRLSVGQQHLHAEIKTATTMIEDCWPAILATCSTFLYATLDHSFFHSLVRCFQKLTHVAGLLGLTTPRDAFLTTLSKSAVPPHKLLSNTLMSPGIPFAKGEDKAAELKGFRFTGQSVAQSPSKPSDEFPGSTLSLAVSPLNARNLLCLRALLNLGIALGSLLGEAWSIIFDTWQQADFVIHTSSRDMRRHDMETDIDPAGQPSSHTANMPSEVESEVLAVDAAGLRLLESTAELSDDGFVSILNALSKLLGLMSGISTESGGSALSSPKPLSPLASPTALGHKEHNTYKNHRNTASQIQVAQFCLNRFETIATVNMIRLTGNQPQVNGWTFLMKQLIQLACSSMSSSSIRLKSAEVLNTIVKEAATSTIDEKGESSNSIQLRSLEALQAEIYGLTQVTDQRSVSAVKIDVEVHQMALESLKVILENGGEAIITGWSIVFDIITSVFDPITATQEGRSENGTTLELDVKPSIQAKSSKLIRSSFSSLQLVCSDFLSSLPSSCVPILVEALFIFCSQHDDLNISLTTISLFWTVSALLQAKCSPAHFEAEVKPAEDESDKLNEANPEDGANAIMSMWMLLLLRLTDVTVDPRPDIRNGAIQSIFRIFDAYGDQMLLEARKSCIDSVLFKLIEQNAAQQQKLETLEDPRTDHEKKSWDETIVIVISGIADVFTHHVEHFLHRWDSQAAWGTLIRYLDQTLDRHRLDLTVAVFASIRRMLANVVSTEDIDSPSLELVWSLWLDYQPAEACDGSDSRTTKQDALVVYVQCFKELHRLAKRPVTEPRAIKILQSLFLCVVRSDSPSSKVDVGKLTPLQAEVFETIKLLPADVPGITSALLNWLAKFVTLPIDRKTTSPESGPFPFLAIADASMRLIQSAVLSHVRVEMIYTSGAFERALQALAQIINLHYVVGRRPGSSGLRSIAISTSLGILASAIPSMKNLTLKEHVMRRIWDCIVDVVKGILQADNGTADGSIDFFDEQDSDIAAFLTIRDLVVPALGFSYLPDKTRRAYAESLFNTSFIHKPEPGDMPSSKGGMFNDLYEIRMGRTYHPPTSKRSKMGYVCLEELFSLVARHDGSQERVRLAQAGSPFLILRAAITLRGYIADQPLRGRMPQPLSQRRELLFILDKLLSLECEAYAIPDAPGATSENKKHLHRVFPLVSKAVKVAWRDQKVLDKLSQIIGSVSEEMGIV